MVLITRTRNGTHEFPFLPLAGIDGANRAEKASALQNRIIDELQLAPELKQTYGGEA